MKSKTSNRILKMNLHRIILSFYFSICSVFLVSAQLSSSIDVKFIEFTGSFEKDLFGPVSDKSTEYFFKLMISASPVDGAQVFKADYERVLQVLSEFQSPSFAKKSGKQKVKLIQKKLQDSFLKYYKQDGRFDQLFIDGRYNCFTASALVAFAFEYLNIPYDLRQEEEAVYVNAFPGQDHLELRFKDPALVVYHVEDRVKTAYLGFLAKTQKITPAEENGSQSDEIFKQYYYGNSLIHLDNLAGLLYLYAAFNASIEKNLHQALDMMLKSCILNPSQRQIFFTIALLGNCFNEAKFASEDDWNLFIIASWLLNQGVESQEIIGEYGKMTQSQLIENSKIDLYSKASDYIISNIRDISLKVELDYIRKHETGRYYYSQAKLAEAGKCFEEAFQLKPKNVEAQSAFVGTLTPQISSLSLKERVEKLEAYQQSFPELSGNGIFMYLRLHTLLNYFSMLYDMMEIKDAEMQRNTFEKLFNENNKVDLSQGDVGEAYTSAALYYFKKGQSAKAKEMLKRGLEFSPDNELLKYRLRSL